MLSSPLSSHDLVGRQPELAFLIHQLRAITSGVPLCVPLSGEAGIGKTRLLAEFCRVALAEDAVFISTACQETAQNAPGVLEAIVSGLLGGKARALTNRANTEASSRWMERIIAALDAVAERRPIVVSIDDAQWASDIVLDVLDALISKTVNAPVLIVLSYHTPTQSTRQRFRDFAETLESGRSSVRLARLSDDAVDDLISRLLSELARPPASVLRSVSDLSEGVPRRIEQILRSVMDHGGSDFMLERDMPRELLLDVQARLSRLSEPERDLLRYCAVIGSDFTALTVAHLSGTPTAEVSLALQHAWEAKLLISVTSLSKALAFKHRLTQALLHDELFPARARELHALIAADLRMGEPTVALAGHCAAAGNGPEAAAVYERCGDSARQAHDYVLAARLYHQVIDASYAWDESSEHVFEKLGSALAMLGSVESPAPWWRAACEEYERAGCLDRLAACWLDYSRHSSLELRSEEVEEATRRIHAVLDDQPEHTLHWFADVVLGRHYARIFEADRALEALASADERPCLRTPTMTAMLHEARAAAYTQLGREEEFILEGDASIALAKQHGLPELAAQSNQLLGSNMAYYGRTREAASRFQTLINSASEHGYLWRAAFARLSHANILFSLGNFAEAQREVHLVLDARIQQTRVRLLACSIGTHLGVLMDDSRMLALAADESMIDVAFATGESGCIASIVVAFCELYRSYRREEDAVRLLQRALPLVKSAYGAWEMLVLVAQLGTEDDIARAHGLFADFPGLRADHVLITYRDLFEAHVARRRVDLKTAERLGIRSAQRFGLSGQRFFEARAMEVAGQLTGALRLHRAMGSVHEVARLERAVTACSVAGIETLTQRQRDVVALVAEGMTNREVANALSISEKTVEHHLGAIFARLEVTSRSQLIARVLAVHGHESNDRPGSGRTRIA